VRGSRSDMPSYGDRLPQYQASYDVEPADTGRVAFAGQKRGHLVEWKADDVAVGAHDLDDEASGDALRGVATGLAAPFTRAR